MSEFKSPYMAVACPTCGATVGHWCKRPSGHSGPMVAFHAARRKAVEEAAARVPCEACGGIGMIYRPGLSADRGDGFEEGMDECPACTGNRLCPKCGGEMYCPADLDPEEDDDETDICQCCGFGWDVETRAIASFEVQERIMWPDHPRWREFVARLSGPEGCNFQTGEDGVWRWRCGGGTDQSLSRAILETMGDLDVEGSLAYFSAHGGHCDCEVLFNVDPDEDEE